MATLVRRSLTNRQALPLRTGFDATPRSALFSRLASTVRLWRRRMRERRELALISPHDLRDMGVSQSDVWHEIRQPFWRSSLRR